MILGALFALMEFETVLVDGGRDCGHESAFRAAIPTQAELLVGVQAHVGKQVLQILIFGRVLMKMSTYVYEQFL